MKKFYLRKDEATVIEVNAETLAQAMAMVGGEGYTDETESIEDFMTMVNNDDYRGFEDVETEESEDGEEE